ncbi:cell wall hydrolase [Archangium violaceum]|uniref:cell wall hydrolase n=1 Tax=Archangium violaceum TaxID=83451 RepID=UPI00193B8A6B|nr:cell wall hydrolase [Archangium violaceum]QRK11605.1 cell wall hydrolase [Archangium violaceum]
MAQTASTPEAESHGDCQIPLGYDGIVRIRAAPHLVLTLEEQSQPALQDLDNWQVVVGGSYENLEGSLPCRLEWTITSDSFAEKKLPHRRETFIVPNGGNFVVHEKDGTGTRPLRISVFELGLIGKGRLGYRLEPVLFGNEAVEVLPEDSRAIAYELEASIGFKVAPEELARSFFLDKIEVLHDRQVGTVMQLTPTISPLFKGMQATLDIFPLPPEGLPPDEKATVRIEWEVGDPDAASRLIWKIGFMSILGVFGELLNDDLAAVGGVESSPSLAFQYQLTLARKPPPPKAATGKGAKKQSAPAPIDQVRSEPLRALEVPRPRLKEFKVLLDDGKLGVRCRFEHFNDFVVLGFELKPYARVPEGEGWRVEELDDYLKTLFIEELVQESLDIFRNASTRSPAFFIPTSTPEDVFSRLTKIDAITVTIEKNKFEHELLDLNQLPREFVRTLKKIRGLEVFVAMRPTGIGGRVVPFWAIADYDAAPKEHEQNVPRGRRGFAPFDGGAFVSRVFASGVCSSDTVDLSGHAAQLYSPLPTIPPESREDFEVFVATVCGESIGQSEASWRGVAHTIMNRVARKYESWEGCLTPTEVIQKTGFEGYKSTRYEEARTYMKSPAASSLVYRDKLARMITLLTPIFMRQDGNCGDVVYFYSPSAQRKLGRSAPSWVNQKDGKDLVRITDAILGSAKGKEDKKDDFEFYTFKYPEKWPRMTPEERAQARAARSKAKSK